MNVVIMCDSFAPKPSPNGICAGEVAKALKKNGHCVSVVTLPNGAGQAPVEDFEGVTVYREEPGYVLRTLNQTENKTDKASAKKRNRALRYSRFCGMLYAFRYPLTAPEQVGSYYKRLCALHAQQPVDLLVCCYHKIAAVAAGIRFKKEHPEVKFIVYTLDAISGGLVFPVLHSKKISMDSLKRWEKRIFAVADKMFVMESHRTHYQQREYDAVRPKLEFLDIPLVRTDRMADAHTPGEKVRLVYTGSMSRETADPTYLLSLMKEITADHCIEIYGNLDEDIRRCLEQADPEGKIIKIMGRVPYEQIDSLQKQADVLLNFGNANSCMIPCKIFEYISTGNKIISFTHSPQDSSLPYMRRYANALIIDENGDRQENIQSITAFLQKKPEPVTGETLRKDFEKNTAEYFCRQAGRLFEE